MLCRDECWSSGRLSTKAAPAVHFLKTLFWALVAVSVALFARSNWFDVTLNLWDDIRLDIKLPLLLMLLFLLGLVPPLLVYRARMWRLRRRVEAQERQQMAAATEPAPADEAHVA